VAAGAGGALNWRRGLEPQPLPEEWVLRQLRDADLDHDEDVLVLLGFGVISRPYLDPAQVPPPAREGLAAMPSDTLLLDAWWRTRSDGTIEDARWWLKTARALAGAWSKATLGEDPTTAWREEGFAALNDEAACWAQCTLALNEGLRPFRAHVEYAQPRLPGFVHGLPRVGLYSAACRQIFNFAVEQQTARRCENATCGRVFVHQLGGAKFRQHRSTGLRYCTPECARAEASRQYRRRKAAGKEKP
jgi:hypothetical protein